MLLDHEGNPNAHTWHVMYDILKPVETHLHKLKPPVIKPVFPSQASGNSSSAPSPTVIGLPLTLLRPEQPKYCTWLTTGAMFGNRVDEDDPMGA